MTISDAELLALFARHDESLRTYAQYLTRARPGNADDVLQEMKRRVIGTVRDGTFDPSRGTTEFFRRIMRNYWWSQGPRDQREPVLVDAPLDGSEDAFSLRNLLMDDTPDPEEIVMQADMERHIHAALDRLPTLIGRWKARHPHRKSLDAERAREILSLRFAVGLSQERIAAVIGVKRVVIRTYLKQLHAILRWELRTLR